MPRVRQPRTSKAKAIQHRSKQKKQNESDKAYLLDDIQELYTNIYNINFDQKRTSWKHQTTVWKFTYKKLCDRYVNNYVFLLKHDTDDYDLPNINGFGIIVGFELQTVDGPIIIDDEIFHNPKGHDFYDFPLCDDLSCTVNEIRMVIHDIFNPKLRLGTIPYLDMDLNLIHRNTIDHHFIESNINYYYNVILKNKIEPPKNYETHECGICLDDMVDKKLLLPCGHTFHKECIDMWKKESIFCPYCKAQMDGTSFNALMLERMDVRFEYILPL
jgi:hypothetical protein